MGTPHFPVNETGPEGSCNIKKKMSGIFLWLCVWLSPFLDANSLLSLNLIFISTNFLQFLTTPPLGMSIPLSFTELIQYLCVRAQEFNEHCENFKKIYFRLIFVFSFWLFDWAKKIIISLSLSLLKRKEYIRIGRNCSEG